MKDKNTISYRESAWDFHPNESLSLCNKCKHHIEGVHCKAFPFPQQIPDEILFNELKHTTLIEGQQGRFMFEEKETRYEF